MYITDTFIFIFSDLQCWIHTEWGYETNGRFQILSDWCALIPPCQDRREGDITVTSPPSGRQTFCRCQSAKRRSALKMQLTQAECFRGCLMFIMSEEMTFSQAAKTLYEWIACKYFFLIFMRLSLSTKEWECFLKMFTIMYLLSYK